MPFQAKPAWSRAAAVAAIAVAFGLVVLAVGKRYAAMRAPLIPPASSSATVVRATPNVLIAVRDLARLESAAFHMERVIDLSEKQSHLFGLVEGEDAILLVAVADVTAGVDLSKLTQADVDVEANSRRARVRLPAPEIFHTALDNERTYVHTRKTSTLARRQEGLETRARREAERTLVEAAREAGVLDRAGENARRVVEGLVRSLGYADVEVTVERASAVK